METRGRAFAGTATFFDNLDLQTVKMVKGKKYIVVEEKDAMDVVNDLELDVFVERFWLDG